MAAAAVTVARGSVAVLHAPPAQVQVLLGQRLGGRLSGVLLRAEIAPDRALLALAVRDLRGRGLAVGVLKQRLSWVAERRALFGTLAPDAGGGLPPSLLRRLSHRCYGDRDDPRTDPTRAAEPERRDHAGVGSR